MTFDYTDRPVEMLLLDGFLLATIEHIARLRDPHFMEPLIHVLGVLNTDRIVATHEILAESQKSAARYIVFKAQACGYIDIHDGMTIREMINNMGTTEEFRKWN